MDLFFLIIVTTIYYCTCHHIQLNSPHYQDIYPAVELSSDMRTHLFFALIQSFGSELNSSGNIAGVQVALDRINDSPNILPNHLLHYTLTDSKCKRNTALDALFIQLLPNDNISKAAVLGSGCSVATEATAEVSHYYNLTHISCSSASTELLDRSRFRRHFQLLQTMRDIDSIYLTLISHYKWKYIAIITQNENLFTVAVDSLKISLESMNVSYSEKQFESNESIAGLRNSIDPSAHIFIVASYERHALAFLCEASRRNLKYPTHLIIFMGWYDEEWWLKESNGTCSQEERVKTLPLFLSVHHFNYQVHDFRRTTSGIRGFQYKNEEQNKISGPPYYRRSQFSPYCYDATWTLAYALHNTLQENANISIKYDNEQFHQRMFAFVNNSDFIGVTGPVKFSAEGIRETNQRQVFQFRRNESGTIKMIKVGDVVENKKGSFDFIRAFPDESLWPNGPPRDGVPVNQTVMLSLAITQIIFILGAAGCTFTIICIIFTIYFRERRIVKLSSPKLNYIIGLGALLLYVDVFLHAVPTETLLAVGILCKFEPWFIAIGYSLCHGTIVCKIIRIHLVFNYTKIKTKQTVSDWKLGVGVLLLVILDVTILGIFNAMDDTKVERILNRENPTASEPGFGIVAYHYFLVCKSSTRDAIIGVLLGYKALLQMIALILAIFIIHDIKSKGMDCALYAFTSVYITSLLWALKIMATYTLFEHLNASAVVISMSGLVAITTTVGMTFIPMMVQLYKERSFALVANTPISASSAGTTKDTAFSIVGVSQNRGGLAKPFKPPLNKKKSSVHNSMKSSSSKTTKNDSTEDKNLNFIPPAVSDITRATSNKIKKAENFSTILDDNLTQTSASADDQTETAFSIIGTTTGNVEPHSRTIPMPHMEGDSTRKDTDSSHSTSPASNTSVSAPTEMTSIYGINTQHCTTTADEVEALKQKVLELEAALSHVKKPQIVFN